MRKIQKNLSKIGTERKIIPKTSSETDFYQFGLDFGVPRRAQKHQKWIKKQAEKTAKNWKAPKHKKNRKRGQSRFGRRNAQAAGRMMEGKRRLPRQPKTMQKIEDRN